MLDNRRAYDISVVLGEESIDYPGDTPYSRELIRKLKDGDLCNLSKLTMSPHCGTHVDFPAHFVLGGKTVDQYSVTDFILPASVVEIEDKEAIRPCELENLLVEPGDALLFKTENSRQGWCRCALFLEEFVYMISDAADLCIEKEAALVGIDYITIERYGDNAFPVHRKLLENNLLILEGTDLSQVPPGRYTLICLPVKIKGCESSPVRAILLA
ncbi:MAG: cyclase family protein [Desulfomonile tiedjei]|nr:cyclase family protein [Desulfomonile tiedjei]